MTDNQIPLSPAGSSQSQGMADPLVASGQNQKQQTTVHGPGGLEGQPMSIETGAKGAGVESAQEALKPAEKSQEQQVEKKTQQPQPKPIKVKDTKQLKQEAKKKIVGLKPITPSVYGYKIPPKIANNPKLVSQNVGKGNFKKGMAGLYVFLDRLLKMNKVKNG